MSTPELKPCPNQWCKKSAPEMCLAGLRGGYFVRCASCSVHAPQSKLKATAIENWNTRHNPAESALNAAREAIENAPHEPTCNHDTPAEFAKRHGLKTVCDCWKAEALAQIDAVTKATV